MALRVRSRRGIRLPVTLSVLLITVNVILMICWIVLLARAGSWSMLTIGTLLFAFVLAGLGIYLYVTIREIQLNQRQANFVDSVTHELKSPLTSLKLYLETLQIRPLEGERRASIYDSMLQDVERLQHLIDQLLEIGRLDAIATDLQPEDVNIEDLLNRCAEEASLHQRVRREVVAVRGPAAVVRGSRLALEMVFRNLIDNAIKYGGENPRVEIDVSPYGNNQILIHVADNGAGVPPELRKRIFGLFFRGGNELKRTTKGTGLGLYIVQTLVQKMKGWVGVHDRRTGTGAVFEVLLPGRVIPRIASAAVAEGAASETAPVSQGAS
jgi:two-component system, OmpR family, phosphate regulon sensor histidine kinase PhoR